jgi:hypothetical protein
MEQPTEDIPLPEPPPVHHRETKKGSEIKPDLGLFYRVNKSDRYYPDFYSVETGPKKGEYFKLEENEEGMLVTLADDNFDEQHRLRPREIAGKAYVKVVLGKNSDGQLITRVVKYNSPEQKHAHT